MRRKHFRRCKIAKRKRAHDLSVWVLDFEDQDGGRHVEVARNAKGESTREAAYALREKRLGEVATSTYTAPDADLVAFPEVAKRFVEASTARETTKRDYRGIIEHHLAPHFGLVPFVDITLADCERLRESLRTRGKKPATINKSLTIATMIFTYATRHGIVQANPMRLVKHIQESKTKRRVRAARLLSPAELGRMLGSANPRYRVALATLAYTGLRVSELVALRWRNVNLDARVVSVTCAIREGIEGEPKSDASVRDIDLPQSLKRELLAHKLASPFKRDDDFVFSAARTETSQPIDARNLYHRGLRAALKNAGIEKATGLHDLRHGYASSLLAAGVNIARVSALLGHGSPAITLQVYSHLMPVERDDAADKLDAILGTATGYMSVTSRVAAEGGDAQVIEGMVPSHGFEPWTPSLRKRDEPDGK